MPKLVLVAAIAENGVIGRENALPWGNALPRDMARFVQITKTCGTVLMGRKTAESLSKPLPGRRNLVLSRDPKRVPAKFQPIQSLEMLNTLLQPTDVVAVIGGAEIYRLAAPHAHRAYLTRVHESFSGDAFYPIDTLYGFERKGEPQRFAADEKNAHAMTFYVAENVIVDPL